MQENDTKHTRQKTKDKRQKTKDKRQKTKGDVEKVIKGGTNSVNPLSHVRGAHQGALCNVSDKNM
jgi:hypothetical protein